MNIIIKPSNKPDKKYMAIIDDRKTIHFGAKNYSDFTIHKDEERKQRYLNRHKKNENWNDPLTASFYATNILWKTSTITDSIKDTNQRFKNINIKLGR